MHASELRTITPQEGQVKVKDKTDLEKHCSVECNRRLRDTVQSDETPENNHENLHYSRKV